jgi:hypothetical protein
MGSAFAIENVPRFAGAFSFAPLRLFATADVGANLIAAGNLLFRRYDRRSDRYFLLFRHFHVSVGSVRVNLGSDVLFILLSPGCPG